MTVHYTEGSARAVIRGETVVVLPGASDDALLRDLWAELADAPDGVAAALGVLTSREGGLRAVPPFAVVSVQKSGSAHVAVRGAGVDVTVATAAGPVPVSGQDVVSWSERVIEQPTSFVVAAGPSGDARPADGAAAGFPVESAVVAAGSVRRVLVEGAEPTTTAAPAAGLDEAAVFARIPGVKDTPPVPAPPAPGRHADGGTATTDPLGTAAGTAGAAGAPGPAFAPPGKPADSPVTEATQIGAGDDEYEHLFGETIMRSVEDAAVRASEDEDDDEHAPKEPEKPAVPAPVPAPPAPPAAPAAPPAGAEAPGLISAVPGGFPGSSPAAPGGTPAAAHRAASIAADASQETIAPGGDEPDDHDGHTVMQSDLADLRRAGGLDAAASGPGQASSPATSSATGNGPKILAVTCPSGHANPPSRPTCRTCGDDLAGEPAPAPRPALGRLVVSTGSAQVGAAGPRGEQVVELDRAVIVGRRPRTSTTSASGMPRLVTVSSPNQDISRSHLEVSLEEWQVLVSDLATTNGTTLLRPGQPPRRLHPNEKEIVADGDVVDLGDGVTLKFEGIW